MYVALQSLQEWQDMYLTNNSIIIKILVGQILDKMKNLQENESLIINRDFRFSNFRFMTLKHYQLSTQKTFIHPCIVYLCQNVA